MKQLLYRYLVLIGILLFISQRAYTRNEEETTWRWPRYGIGIDVKQELQITAETDSMLQIGNDNIEITMLVLNRSIYSDTDIGHSLIEFATESGLDLATSSGSNLCSKELSGSFMHGNIANGHGLIAAGVVGLNTLWGFVIIMEYRADYEPEALEILHSLNMKPL